MEPELQGEVEMRRRMIGVACLAAWAAMLAAGCGSGITTGYDFDPTYPFDSVATYDWMPVTVSAQVGELRVRRLMTAFDDELQRMGMRKVESSPDFRIKLHGSTKQRTDVSTYGYSYGRRWGGATAVDVNTYTEGTMIFDFVDSETNEVFWRGTANKIVDAGASPDKQEKTFAQVARQVLSHFPPDK
jgi:hypothetical protein